MPKIKYHPKRLYQTRSYAKKLLKEYCQLIGRDIAPDFDQFNKLSNMFKDIYNAEISKLPFDKRPDNMLANIEELSMFMYFGAYYTHGQNIFDFNEEITEEFINTEVDDVLLASIKLPYKCFYLCFGPQKKLSLNEKYFIDGAYICEMQPGSFHILLTSIRYDFDYTKVSNFVLNKDQFYHWKFENEEEKNLTVKKAIENYIKRERPFEEIEINPKVEYIDTGDNKIKLTNNFGHSQNLMAQETLQNYEIFRESLKLIFNSLCYLTSYRKNIIYKYPDDIPSSLRKKLLNSKKAKDKNRNESKLSSMGFTKINFCGSEMRNKNISDFSTNIEVSTHWRRGHWRQQAYGPKQLQHRLIWIRPTIVRRDKGEPLKGHIYHVEENAE